jgi:hypothetical protein
MVQNMQHMQQNNAAKHEVDCSIDPDASLTEMFVNIIQKGRIDNGQCPALRPVFLKPHGVAKGVFKMKSDLPDALAVGLFKGEEYPVWARFSSDTLPSISDYKTTCGIGLKLFDTPTPKIFGLPDETTSDFIMQNHPVFFVDTAKDMCEFTKAGVIDGDYDPYLDAHPNTKKILDEMAKPVGSVLASPYWGILPFSLGPNQYVKYMLKPTIEVVPPHDAPADPTYLAQEMVERLAKESVTFEFCIQLRTNDQTMPLDEATVLWPEDESPFVAVAEITFDTQDITARGQAAYGENLSMNIWRVTEEHRPQGSIADARKVVYEASAEQRRNANGIPDGEPVCAKPAEQLPPCRDDVIVRAAIHPGIGLARVGDAQTSYYIGPEVTHPQSKPNGSYRTPDGSLKREAARFRIYGYNAAGEVVGELTAANADITWTAHVVNQKANWFHFITAMDIPETKDLSVTRRNPKIAGADRAELIIDPGPRSITGASVSGGREHRFDSGEFKGEQVYLGELQTDEQGHLLFLGGHGKSESPSGNPPFDKDDPDSFNNAADWYDDMSDGPVNAEVNINGQQIPVEGAWVVTAPPNYAPDIIGWRTMFDLMSDVYIANGWLPVPETTSFTKDVLPQLQRLSNLQWVNKGFATMFGKGRPMDFNNPEFITQLAYKPLAPALDPYGELRKSPNTMLALPAMQQLHLQRWADGAFIADWDLNAELPSKLEQVPLAEQPAMLDQAAMHFCLADAFHPGCEMTWPMRHASMYRAPFRIRQSDVPESPTQFGGTLTQQSALATNGPLYAQVAGGITRWMGIPWQGDTAFCRAGYNAEYDLTIPSFWPAHVPNTVLTEENYKIVMDASLPRAVRIVAYNNRASWNRFMDADTGSDNDSTAKVMEKMIATFGAQGIIEARPGIKDDPDFGAVIYVENVGESLQSVIESLKAAIPAKAGSLAAKLEQSSWSSEHLLQQAVNLRARRKNT